MTWFDAAVGAFALGLTMAAFARRGKKTSSSSSSSSSAESKQQQDSAPRRPTVCVYCGSRGSGEFLDAARLLGTTLASRGIDLVYGGGSFGLMGEVARAVTNGGGKVTSVIPRALVPFSGEMVQRENVIYVEDMHTRKRKMGELADAFIALPGGLGTLEELLETATWVQLGVTSKPIGILNIQDFYGPLREQFARGVSTGFIGKDLEDGGCLFEESVDKLLTGLFPKGANAPTASKVVGLTNAWSEDRANLIV